MKREQRWRERKERWVAPADRPLFDPEGFEVRPVAEGPARVAAARLRKGLPRRVGQNCRQVLAERTP